jgi:protein involved in polysaccharide export with SLBB domain
MSLFNRFRNIPKYQNIPLDFDLRFEFFMTAGVRLITDRKDVPVPPKYVVGPGDEIRILLWGGSTRNTISPWIGTERSRSPRLTHLRRGQTFEDFSKQVIKQSEQIVAPIWM